MSRLRTMFLTGLLLLVPAVLTVWILQFLLGVLDGFSQPLLVLYLGREIPGAGAVLTAFIILCLGAFSNLFIGRRIFDWVETQVGRIPFVRSVYSTTRQVVHGFSSNEGVSFKRTVIIKRGDGSMVMGFVTREFSMCTSGADDGGDPGDLVGSSDLRDTGEVGGRAAVHEKRRGQAASGIEVGTGAGDAGSAGNTGTVEPAGSVDGDAPGNDGLGPFLAVYIPTNHLYLGDVFLVPPENVVEIDMSLEEGISAVLSCGGSLPPTVYPAPLRDLGAEKLIKEPQTRAERKSFKTVLGLGSDKPGGINGAGSATPTKPGKP